MLQKPWSATCREEDETGYRYIHMELQKFSTPPAEGTIFRISESAREATSQTKNSPYAPATSSSQVNLFVRLVREPTDKKGGRMFL